MEPIGVSATATSAPDLASRGRAAEALCQEALALDALGRHEGELLAYDEVVDRFGDAPERELRRRVAWAHCRRAGELRKLGRTEEACAVCDEVVERFGASPEEVLRQLVANALHNKAFMLDLLGRSEDALELFEQIVDDGGDAPEGSLTEEVATALNAKGSTLRRLGRVDEAVEAFDEVLNRFGDDAEPALRQQAAWARWARRSALGKPPEPPSDALLDRCARLFELPDGRQVGYLDVGAEHGQVVLMAHGIPGSRLAGRGCHEWGEACGVRFVTPDRPGFGLSSAVTAPSKTGWAKDAICLLDHLGIGQLAAVGVSGGAGYAMALASALPHRVKAVALLGGACPWDRSTAREAAFLTRFLMSPLGAPASAVSTLAVRRLGRMHSDEWIGELLRGSADDWRISEFVEAVRQGSAAYMRDWQQHGSWEFPFSSVAQPVRLWHGARDRRASARLAHRLARSLPRGEMTLVPGGHDAPGTRIDEVLSWLQDRLD